MASDTVVVGRTAAGRMALVGLGDHSAATEVDTAALAAAVSACENDGDVSWVWADTAAVYPRLRDSGVRFARALDRVW